MEVIWQKDFWRILDMWLIRLEVGLEGRKIGAGCSCAACSNLIFIKKEQMFAKILAIIQINEYNRRCG